jgi:hypothetical protein
MASTIMSLDGQLKDYRTFISKFRPALGVGGAANPDGVLLSLPGDRFLCFAPNTLYLTHVGHSAKGPFTKLQCDNYAQMQLAADMKFTRGNIQSAVQSCVLAGGEELARILLVTAEAARSQLVYQVCQQVLQSNAKSVTWGEIKALLNNWQTYTNNEGKDRYHHKRRPIAYGPLGARDYYPGSNAEVDASLQALRAKGMMDDA